MNFALRALWLGGATAVLSLCGSASGAILNGTRCDTGMAPESLFDCLAAAMKQPEVFNLLQVAATACLQETGAVTKRCVGLTIQNTADRMPLSNPSPPSVMPTAPPRAQAPQPVNPCDPFLLARRVQSAAPAGTDPAVLY